MRETAQFKQLFALLIGAYLIISVILLLGSTALVLLSPAQQPQLLVVTSVVAGSWSVVLMLLGAYVITAGRVPPLEWPERLHKPSFIKPVVTSYSMRDRVLVRLVGAAGLIGGLGTSLYVLRMPGELGLSLAICGALG